MNVKVLFVWLLLTGVAYADRVDDLSRQLRNDSDYKVRLSAALNLGKLGDKRAIPALTDALKDSDKTVRGVSAAALGKLVDSNVKASDRDRAISELKRVAGADSDNFVRGQAQKAYDNLKNLGGPPPGGSKVYVEVGPMSDGTKKAAAVIPIMRSTIEDTINKKAPSYATKWPTGKSPTKSELSSAGTKAAFYVDGTLTTIDVKKTGSMAEVSCNVSLIIASFPEKSMFGFLKGGAAVQTGTSEKAVAEAKSDCVGAVVEDLVARQVVPTIQGRVP